MPKYNFWCPACGITELRYKRISDLDKREFCVHETDLGTITVTMQRLFTASFQIIAHRQADMRENKLYDILTKGGGETDKLALFKEDQARLEQTLANTTAPEKVWTSQDILETGIVEANRSGQVGLDNWRKEWISEKTYSDGETITS